MAFTHTLGVNGVAACENWKTIRGVSSNLWQRNVLWHSNVRVTRWQAVWNLMSHCESEENKKQKMNTFLRQLCGRLILFQSLELGWIATKYSCGFFSRLATTLFAMLRISVDEMECYLRWARHIDRHVAADCVMVKMYFSCFLVAWTETIAIWKERMVWKFFLPLFSVQYTLATVKATTGRIWQLSCYKCS